MSKWIVGFWLAVSLGWAWGNPAIAADLNVGARLFQSNCTTCHLNGGNVINGPKTLRKEALRRYGMDSLDALQQQITNGKSAMPAFKQRLTPEQVEAVAIYVLDRAEQGWNSR